MKYVVTLLFVLSLGYAAQGESTSQPADPNFLCEEIIACLEGRVEEKRAVPPPNREEDSAEARAAYSLAQTQLNSLSSSLKQIREVQAALIAGDYGQATQKASTHGYRVVLSGDCGDLWSELQQAIAGAQDNEIKAFQAKFEAFEKELGNFLPNATEADQFDQYIERIAVLNSESTKVPKDGHRFQNMCNSLLNITTTWQDYLACMQYKDYDKAERELSSLDNLLKRSPIVPRSILLQIRERVRQVRNSPEAEDKTASVDTIVITVKSYDDLAQARDDLRAFRHNNGTNNDAGYYIDIINQLLSTKGMIEDGNPSLAMSNLQRLPNALNKDTSWSDDVRLQLFSDALYLSIPDEHRPDPRPESLEVLITQTASGMKENEDWQALWEFLTVTENMQGNRFYSANAMPSLRQDMDATKKFINAQRLEEAGNVQAALQMYSHVLAHPGKYGPYQETQEAMKRLWAEKLE